MKKKNALVRSIALLAIVLLIGVGIGGTMAWLMDYTNEVENTFTVGNINIDLKETVDGNSLSTDVDGKIENDTFKIIPGRTETKDPTVIVKGGSEDCYVFVKVIEKNTTYNNVEYVTWEIDSEWTYLLTDGLDDGKVYYRVHSAKAENQAYSVLENDQVTYSSKLTKAQIDDLQTYINSLDEPTSGLPSLTFKAYAVQYNYLKDSDNEVISGDTVEAATKAWAVLNPTT